MLTLLPDKFEFQMYFVFTEKERDDETKHKGDYSQSPRHWFPHITGLVYNLFELNKISFTFRKG